MRYTSDLKIVQLFDTYSNFYQPYIPPIIDELQKQKGFDFKIIAFSGERGQRDEVDVLPNYRKRKLLSKLLQLQNKEYQNLEYFEIKVLKEKVDIIHIQHSYLFPKVINLLKIPNHKRPKIVITLRGGDTYIKPWLYAKWTDFYKIYGNKVDAFVVMSEDQKSYLHTKWGVEANRIHVVPISFGIGGGVESKYPNTDVMKIISAFRMCWEKNIEGNLRTVKLLKERGVPVQYEIYGNGPDTGQLYYLIDQYNLSDCVSYFGKIENKELKEILPKFDFFLQLSHSEALPTTIIEAQSKGVPVMVSNSGGMPEALLNGETGFSVNSYDVEAAAEAMLKLWQDPEKYNSFSRKAISFVNSKFTISEEVNKLKKLYLALTKQ